MLVIWFTGLSGSGKTTIAKELIKVIKEIDSGIKIEILDGETMKRDLLSDLSYNILDLRIALDRITFVAKLLAKNDVISIITFISPFGKDRNRYREEFKKIKIPFIEVYLECRFEELEKRDTKGLYQKAKNGEINNFAGVNLKYDIPINPEIIINTEEITVKQAVAKIIEYLDSNI